MDLQAPLNVTETNALDTQIEGLQQLLNQYRGNRIKLLRQKANYASGEEQLRHLNQIEDEKNRIAEVQSELESLLELRLMRLVVRANLQPKELQRLYDQSRPKTLAKPRRPIAAPDTAVSDLWGMRNQDDRALPVMEFSERLALRVEDKDGALATQIREWRLKLLECEALPVNSSDVEAMTKRLVTADDQKRPHLLVEVIPALSGGLPRYWLRAYLWHSGGDSEYEPWDLPEDDGVDQSGMTYTFDELLQRVIAAINQDENNDPDTIEFLLPLDLLAKEIDQQTFPMADDDLKFCYKYAIVIRSLDRIRGPNMAFGLSRKEWRNIWGLFSNWKAQIQNGQLPVLTEAEIPTVTWLSDPDGYASREARVRVLNELFRDKHKGVCLGLTFVPSTELVSQQTGSLLRTLLMAGVPIMVWSRKHQRFVVNFEEIRQEMETIVCTNNLPQLQVVIHKLRVCEDAYRGVDHMGNHLALFWDDPNLVPPAQNRDVSVL